MPQTLLNRLSKTSALFLFAAILLPACSSESKKINADYDLEQKEEEEAGIKTASDFLPINAVASCSPKADACVEAEPVDAVFAYYRKDYFFPTSVYQEPTEEPLDGGRFHIAAIAKTTGKITNVLINGEEVETLLKQKKIEWHHYWPQTAEAGKPVWAAFHSRSSDWDKAKSGGITVQTENGAAVDAQFDVAANKVPITYVTADERLSALLIHVKNDDSQTRRVKRLIVNGIDVLAAEIACLPSNDIKAGEAAMWTVPLCKPAELGSPWTVVVEFADVSPSVAAGRVIRPFFPIEAWPPSKECALPGVNDEALNTALNGGVDTLYIYWNSYQKCGYDRDKMFFETLPARGDLFLLLGDDFPFDNPPENAFPNTNSILGFLTGDESDWNIYDENGYPNAAKKAAKTRAVWKHYPRLFTYNGAMTNKRIGTFAGMADVQGIDIYAAACAPHVTDMGHHPPLRAPYDYLRNARNNHMPLPTWLYSQGLGGWATQAAAQEILVQALSVAAAGGKGLMWFMFNSELAAEYPETWAAMSKANWMFRGVRNFLREGDPTGMAVSDDKSIVELIRSRRALIIPVISLASDAEPTDALCIRYQLGADEEPPRWIISERKISVELTVPDDFTIADAFEIADGKTLDLPYPAALNGRKLLLKDIGVNNSQPIHLFVFAADKKVKDEVIAATAH